MVSMRPTLLLSDNLSSNPTKDFNFAVKNVDEKNENKQKNAGVGPLNIIDQICFYLLQELVQDQNSSFSASFIFYNSRAMYSGKIWRTPANTGI